MTQLLAEGTELSHYRIVSKLGAGGMGEVYLAQDTSELGRTVALKILSFEVSSHKDRLQRFTQEARAVSNLNHPNILTVHEFGQSDSVFFIATEYIDGVTLREHLSASRSKLIDILDVTIQIVAALNAAHEAGVTHRDLKPENVMVRRDQIIKVLDFGLAKLSEPSAPEGSAVEPDSDEDAKTKVLRTEPGLVMGTVAYMSPEQSAGKSVDHRTDIWSIGVVFYEMLAGCLPFQGKDIHRQIIAIQETEPVPLSQQVEGVPERLEEIVTKCLAKDKNERYQTAKDLLIDLRNLRRKLDVDAEIERTIPPLRQGISVGSSPATQGSQMSAAATSSATAVSTSSAEYIVNGIKRHKITAIVVALVLIAGAVGYRSYLHARDTEVAIESIAVLPFENKSNDPDTDYLSDGLAESLIYRLSQLANLRVSPTSSVIRYKGKETDISAIANALKVNAVMTGRMVKRGDNITISAELIDARYNKLIWGEQYARKMSDLVSLQNEIAREISSQLKVKLSGADQQKLAKNSTNDPEAYRLYLQGRFYWNKRTNAEVDKAVIYFQKAIEKDPSFALGYVGLADSYEDVDRPLKKEYIRRALDIDDNLAEAHASLGYQYMCSQDWTASERELKRAMELNPKYPQAYGWNGARLMMIGKYEESLKSIQQALEIDPTSNGINFYKAVCLAVAGRREEAVQQFKALQELDPTFPWAHSFLSRIYVWMGNLAGAVEERAKSLELDGKPENAKLLRESFATGGWEAFQQESARQRRPNFSIAALSDVSEPDKEKAISKLQERAAKGDFWLFLIRVDPGFDYLRGDSRFQELLKRFNPPQ